MKVYYEKRKYSSNALVDHFTRSGKESIKESKLDNEWMFKV